jgi:hypothetical protein
LHSWPVHPVRYADKTSVTAASRTIPPTLTLPLRGGGNAGGRERWGEGTLGGGNVIQVALSAIRRSSSARSDAFSVASMARAHAAVAAAASPARSSRSACAACSGP